MPPNTAVFVSELLQFASSSPRKSLWDFQVYICWIFYSEFNQWKWAVTSKLFLEKIVCFHAMEVHHLGGLSCQSKERSVANSQCSRHRAYMLHMLATLYLFDWNAKHFAVFFHLLRTDRRIVIASVIIHSFGNVRAYMLHMLADTSVPSAVYQLSTVP